MNAQRFDPNDSDAIVCPTRTEGLLVGSFSVSPGTSAWGALELEVVYRNGQGDWTAYPGVSSLTASARSSGRLDVSWFDEIALRITTVEGTSRIYLAEFSGK